MKCGGLDNLYSEDEAFQMFVVSARWSLTLVARRNDMGEKASPRSQSHPAAHQIWGLGDLFGIASLMRLL